jgi:thioredoxin-like negative regulator of GroEL
MLSRIRILLSIALVLGIGLPLTAQPAQEPSKIPWASSFQAALEQAKAKNRPVFVDVYADWCGWCKRLDQEVFTQDPVAQMLNDHFVPVKVDGDNEPNFSQNYAIEGLPTMLVLEADGSEVGRIAGYKTAEALQKELAEILKARVILHEMKAELAKKPDDLETLYKLGTLCWNLQRVEDTVKYLGRAVDLDTQRTIVNREQALLPLAKSFGLTGSPDRGIGYIEQLMKEFPASAQIAEARFIRAVMLMELGKTAEAKQAAQTLLHEPEGALPPAIRASTERLLQELETQETGRE